MLRHLWEANVATTSFVGGRLRVTSSDAYIASTSRTRSIDLATSGDVDALIVNTLRRNGFDEVHRVVVAPDRSKSRDVGAGQGTAVSLALDVANEEDAVALLEHEGCYTWLRPRHESSRDPLVPGRVATIQVGVLTLLMVRIPNPEQQPRAAEEQKR